MRVNFGLCLGEGTTGILQYQTGVIELLLIVLCSDSTLLTLCQVTTIVWDSGSDEGQRFQ